MLLRLNSIHDLRAILEDLTLTARSKRDDNSPELLDSAHERNSSRVRQDLLPGRPRCKPVWRRLATNWRSSRDKVTTRLSPFLACSKSFFSTTSIRFPTVLEIISNSILSSFHLARILAWQLELILPTHHSPRGRAAREDPIPTSFCVPQIAF